MSATFADGRREVQEAERRVAMHACRPWKPAVKCG